MVSFLMKKAPNAPESDEQDTPSVTKKPTKIDFDTLSASISTKQGSYDITLFGLSDRIISFLALHGAVALLRRRRNPVKTWSDITTGRILEKPRGKQVPNTVRAWAEVRNEPVEDVLREWRSMSRSEQYKVRHIPKVMKKALELRYPELENAESVDESPQ